MLLLPRLCVCAVLLLLLDPVVLFRVPQRLLARETERKDTHEVVSKAIQRLHELFDIGDLPQNALPHRKPPQFMVDLFNAVADSDGITKDPGILEGNVVRSFEDKVHSDQSHYYFNLSSFGRKEKMIKAEFRIFRPKQSIVPGKSFGHHFCKIDVYELLDSGIKPWRGNLVTSRLLPLYTQGWEVINVTQTVSKWIIDSSSNHGFLIVTTLPSGNSLESRFERSQKHGKHAFLVLFSDDGRRGSTATNISPLLGRKALAKDDTPRVPTPSENAVPSDNQVSKSRKIRSASVSVERNPMSCQRLPLYVDFEEIGWSGWIISPKGYNAYHCKGSCPFPLGEGLRATNHATVQSIVNALKLSRDVEMPCCVPDKLHSINLLYFDDEENVVLKQYDDMVAVSCGCH
ncbi:bone morphogenetic protein 2-like [Acipenser oxyrinchus oxyrinchus]|uniref:Bone morphogenetic protein 2-like n=1 Tax=Acipenser oxyrinchus oxyrinchus TaxID=40147 RepID=A0AAD8G0W9_ACIOX|nr:bone morphogenetic protein 2-like [Acipenser oxyrinchus oxyrinchus]